MNTCKLFSVNSLHNSISLRLSLHSRVRATLHARVHVSTRLYALLYSCVTHTQWRINCMHYSTLNLPPPAPDINPIHIAAFHVSTVYSFFFIRVSDLNYPYSHNLTVYHKNNLLTFESRTRYVILQICRPFLNSAVVNEVASFKIDYTIRGYYLGTYALIRWSITLMQQLFFIYYSSL